MMPLHTFDLYTIQSATQRAIDYANDTAKRVDRLLVKDRDRAKRIASSRCRWCWYRQSTSLAGQAFTEFTCWRCRETGSHHNTATPRLCDPCAKQTALCGSCCGDIHGDKRTEVP